MKRETTVGVRPKYNRMEKDVTINDDAGHTIGYGQLADSQEGCSL
jgi:hypothetical protein